MRRKQIGSMVIAGAVLLSGCSQKNLGSGAGENTEAAQETGNTGREQTAEAADGTQEINIADMFSDRDRDAAYDEAESAVIQLSDGGSSCGSDAVVIFQNTVTITDEGTYILSGSLSDGMVVVDAEDTDKVQLVFKGVSISNPDSAAVYIASADKVFITLAEGTENIVSNGGTYTNVDENNIDGVIFSKADLSFNGTGKLTVTATAGHGIVSKDDLIFTGRSYEILAAEQGMEGKDSVRIADGTYRITSGKDGIHGENKDDAALGFVYLAGGTFEIASPEDDGIHAGSGVTIAGGVIDITDSYEGIEGLTVDIMGGQISVTASDDGINAAGGNDGSGMEGADGDPFASTEGAYISISGGNLWINAAGDGLDSNGDLKVSGGETYLSGPVNGGNSSLDYNGTAVITGGVFASTGSSGMAQNFGDSSTQGTMMVRVDPQEAGTQVTLKDSTGAELLSWKGEKEYSSVLISSPKIQQGEIYTLTAGTSETTVSMDSLVYGNEASRGGEVPKGGRPFGGGEPPKEGKPSMNGEPPERGDGPMGGQPSMDGEAPMGQESAGERMAPDGTERQEKGELPGEAARQESQ